MKMYENVENAIKYVLASCEEVRDTHEYSRRFSELSESTANESVKEDLALLARVCSPILDFRTKGTPYVPHINLSDGRRTPVPEDLTDSELRRLSEMLPGIDDARLSARIADVLWIRKFGRDKCQSYRDLAIDRYLAVPINAMSWIAGGGEVSLRRAVALAREDKRRREEILVRISVVVQSSLFGDCGIMMLCPLAQFLLDYNLPNVDESLVVTRLGRGLQEADVRNILLVEEFHETLAAWRKRQGNQAAEYGEIVSKASKVLAWAKAQSPNVEPAVIMGRLEPVKKDLYNLPRTYKESNDLQGLIDDVDKTLETAYHRGSLTMQCFRSDPIDLSGHIRDTKERISGMDQNQALTYLITCFSFRKSDEQSHVETIFDHISMTQVDGEGRPLAHDQNYFERQEYISRIECAVKGILLPAHQEMYGNHKIAPIAFEDLSKRSDFVPAGMKEVVAKGLFYGYNGDYETACYVLLPQLESILRARLLAKGVVTRVKNADPLKEGEVGLSTLVGYCDQVFDENISYEMKRLFGSVPELNLRNEFLHGKLPDCNQSPWAFYTWWFFLKQVCVGTLVDGNSD